MLCSGYVRDGEKGASGNVSLDNESWSDAVGPSSKCLRVRICKLTGKFITSWKLPEHITESKRDNTYAYCKLCVSDFSILHGGLNDTNIMLTEQSIAVKRFLSNCTLVSFYSSQKREHERNVVSAEMMMCQFITMHNLPFEAADHLSKLFPAMFPDEKVANDFACKHTNTKAIIVDALVRIL